MSPGAKKFKAISGSLLSVIFCFAGHETSAQTTAISRLLPPEPYRSMPTGSVRLLRLPTLDDSWRECANRRAPTGSTACSTFYAGVDFTYSRGQRIRRDSLCVVVYSDPGDLPHELGHCRVLRAGGPGGHAGWR